ncbi:MAG: MFS transporter [Bacteroidales bacterium]|jgi:GPH family glycoside/pentoside/hexuronide:cation symporter|nr:MFS transporter [Bacteroidales bacterium]
MENSTPIVTESKSKSTGGEKLAWASGGIAENLSMNTLPTLSYNIFNIGMGISPVVIGFAMSASKFIEGFSDTFFGSLSDNTRSRFGRRRPWIFVGAFLLAIFFVAMWFPQEIVTFLGFDPKSVVGHLGDTALRAQDMYFIIAVSLFFIVVAVWQMPFAALGLEMEDDYTERTKLQTYKQIFSYLIGVLIGSLYLIAVVLGKEKAGGEVAGAQNLAVIIGIAIVFFGIIPALFCRERSAIRTEKQEKVPFFTSVKETFKSKPFILFIISFFFVFMALFFMLPLLGYIHMYHVGSDGMHTVLNWSWRQPFHFAVEETFVTHKELAGYLGVYTAFLQPTTQIITVIILNRVAKYFDKRTVIIAASCITIIGYLSSWIFFSQTYPFLAVLPPVIVNIGLAACWPMIGAFTADICDYDELRTGTRREGMYSAVCGFLIKLAQAIVMIAAAWMLVQIGVDGSNPVITVEKMFTVRVFFVIIPTIAMLGTIFFIWKYPLTKAKVYEIQQQLAYKRAAQA